MTTENLSLLKSNIKRRLLEGYTSIHYHDASLDDIPKAISDGSFQATLIGVDLLPEFKGYLLHYKLR